MLAKLLQIVGQCDDGIVYQALFTLAFWVFFLDYQHWCLYVNCFDPSRFPLVLDLMRTPPGVQMLLKHAKNMQGSSEFKIVYIPKLRNSTVCPVIALQSLIGTMDQRTDPLFMVNIKGTRSVFTHCIKNMGLYPQEFGFHAFRRSGACFAFNANHPLEYIKVHGYWKMNAAWMYLKNAPKAAVAHIFQNLVT